MVAITVVMALLVNFILSIFKGKIMANTTLTQWAKENLTEEMRVSFDDVEVVSYNKDGTLRVKVKDKSIWLNKLSKDAIRESENNQLHIFLKKLPGWKSANWISSYDLKMEESK